MVDSLADGTEAGDTSVNSSMPFKDVSSAFSTGSEHSNISSTPGPSTTAPAKAAAREKRRTTFKALVRATTVSRMMSKLSSHNASSSHSRGQSHKNKTKNKTEQRRRSALSSCRTRAFFNDPNAHLRSILTAEAAPFLHARISQMIPAQVYNLNDFDVSNKLLQDGEFYETRNATFARHRSSPQTREEPYRLKLLHRDIIAKSDEIDLERAATKMMIEGLYLSHLSHPGIVKLRGYNKEGMDTIKHEQPEHFFFVTDHLGETISQRLDSWRGWAAAREKAERRRRHLAKYPAPLVPNTRETSEASILKNKLIKTYPEDLVVLKVNYALQILNALQFIHERGIVVRELRPEAIAFCGYPHHHTIQLCDLSSCREIPRGNKYIPPEGDWKTALMTSSPSTINLMSGVSRSTECSVEDMDDSQYLSPVMENVGDDDEDNEQQEASHSERSVEVQRTGTFAEPEISFASHDEDQSELTSADPGEMESQPTHHEHEGVEAQTSSSGISIHHLASGRSIVTDEVTHYQLDTIYSEEDDGHETETAENKEETSLQNSKQHHEPLKETLMPDISEMTADSFPDTSSQSQENNAKKSAASQLPTAPDASFSPAALLQSLATVNEDDDDQSFYDESERSTDEPIKGPKSTGDTEYHSEDKSTASTGSHSSSYQTNDNAGIFGVRTTVTARRYMAPDLFTGLGGFAQQGYNTQADIYSWAMIFTELLTETRPYGSKQLRKDWTRIVVGTLRPNTKKHHFPRALKCILEQAWQARPEKRGSAAQLSKSLERVLVMLEGQQNPWDTTAGEVSVPKIERKERSPSVLSLLKKSSEKDLEIINQGPTLPERASKYRRWMAKQPQKWSDIWDPRSTRTTMAQVQELQAAAQGAKEDLFARRVKANAIHGI